jgi:hypothetical protein
METPMVASKLLYRMLFAVSRRNNQKEILAIFGETPESD